MNKTVTIVVKTMTGHTDTYVVQSGDTIHVTHNIDAWVGDPASGKLVGMLTPYIDIEIR